MLERSMTPHQTPALVLSAFVRYFVGRGMGQTFGEPSRPAAIVSIRQRGISVLHDSLDWRGGCPFEVASPKQVIDCCTGRGVTLEKLVTTRGKDCTNTCSEHRRHDRSKARHCDNVEVLTAPPVS